MPAYLVLRILTMAARSSKLENQVHTRQHPVGSCKRSRQPGKTAVQLELATIVVSLQISSTVINIVVVWQDAGPQTIMAYPD